MEHTEVSLAHVSQPQLNARIKELHDLIAEHHREIARLEHELAQYKRARLDSAPRGLYRHHRADGTDIEAEAYVLETNGEATYIQYQIPTFKARPGEEDAYLRWLRSPEELKRFTPRAKK